MGVHFKPGGAFPFLGISPPMNSSIKLTPDTPHGFLTMYMTLSGIGVGFNFSVLPSASLQGMDMK